MSSQAQAKQVNKAQVSRACDAQKKEAKRKVDRKNTNVAPAYLQAKLNVSKPEDPHEREADQVADNVMRMPVQRAGDKTDRKIDRAALKPGITPIKRAIARLISRDSLKPGEEEIQRASLKPGEQVVPLPNVESKQEQVQRKEADASRAEEAKRKSESDTPPATDSVENRIEAKRGQGDKLPEGARGDMESRFGRDFSAVRIHTDKDAAEMSRDIEAKAFAVGNDIFFGNGRFDANSDEGRKLLAHELTHVVQQGRAPKLDGEEEPQVSRKDETQRSEVDRSEVKRTEADRSEIERSETQTQRAEVKTSRSEEKAQRWSLTGWIADKAWDLLEELAPRKFYNFVKDVYNKGIFGYLKDKLSSAVSSIFDGLKQGADVLSGFFASFSELAKSAKEIIKELAAGNCKPLFAAVKRLKDTVSAAAGDAWKAITDFFKPIGEFFTDLWKSWGAPVLDWLKKTAGDLWSWLKDLGKTIWDWTKPVRDYASSAWSWLKGKLGLGGEGNSEGGIMGWIKDKAASAWDSIKEVMEPAIKPVKKFAGKVMDVLPIKAILNLRETVQGWLKNAEAMGQAMGDDGSNVADQQVSLREQILPAVIDTMKSVRTSLSSTGLWLSEKIGGIVTDVTDFMSGLRANSILKYVASAISWVETGISNIGNWAKDTVQTLFTMLGDGLVKLSKFIEPVLNTLQQVADTIMNLLGKIPDLILGPLWRAIPKCIRDPLKEFLINQILCRIPFFQQLLGLKDAWEQIKATGLMILKQVFVDGNLLGALWTLFKAILRIFKLPAQLITNVIIKGAQSLGAIIAAPLDFIVNILKAMKLGFSNFFGNILTHLLSGAMNWLFGAVAKAGLTVPEDFSLKSIFGFILDVLGLTMDLVWKKLADKIGQEKVDKLKGMIQYASGALEWIKVAVTEGPGALWTKLKEKLSDLWNMMLDGVIGWINEKIIAWATRWLLSLLDVTGVMPVINATIAVYKAIQSFMEQLKAMLEIINTVLNGVASLAAGAIAPAAGFLEAALVGAIPIVIAFLANQAGLGNIAEKISEILAKIRCKVEEAVGWLVGKVVDAVQAFVDKVKSGVQALKEWWKKKKPFKTKSGESHTLYTQGDKNNLKFMVASKPKDYAAFLAQITIKDDDPKKDEKNKAKTDAEASFATLKDLANKLTASNDADGNQEIHGAKFDEELDKLAGYTAILMDGASNIPVTSPPVYGGLTAAGYGTSMFVPRLTKKGQGESCKSGLSPPTSSVLNGPNYQRLNQRKTPSGSGSFYIKGHLLNDNVHGPGNDARNLTPLTRWTNNTDPDSHLNAVEVHVKREVCENERIVEYKIQAVYDRALNQNFIDTLKASSDPNKDKKIQILEEEAKVPSKLIANASIVGTTKSDDTETTPKPFVSGVIVNNSKRIDTELKDYYVDGESEVVKTLLKLGINDERKRAKTDRAEAEKALGTNEVSGIGSGRIAMVLDTPGARNFSSWDSMKERIKAYALSINGGDDSKASSAATGIYNAFANNDKVTLHGKTEWE